MADSEQDLDIAKECEVFLRYLEETGCFNTPKEEALLLLVLEGLEREKLKLKRSR